MSDSRAVGQDRHRSSPIVSGHRANRSEKTIRVWDLPLRLFHWILVTAVAVAFLSSEEGSPLNQWHILSGWIAGVLVVFRLVWGVVGGEHSRFLDFIRPGRIAHHIRGLAHGRAEPALGHNPLGAIAVIVLLGLVAVTVWTGAFGGEAAEDLHEIIGWTLLAMVGLHIAAVLVMSLLGRENLVGAMITGDKPARAHPGAADAKRPGTAGILIAAVAIAAAVYAILQFDPHAFAPRSTESFEHPSGASAHSSSEQRESEEKD